MRHPNGAFVHYRQMAAEHARIGGVISMLVNYAVNGVQPGESEVKDAMRIASNLNCLALNRQGVEITD